ncbi:hypothetical protein LPJ66_004756 [Kickxella alabastrina]|uniref:Uncharacterized protein n=1 Tax=Kickxella alabastrina TaxID=61397 RepID=A0ACC1IK79_9FUNG|nr:hypothetical protein LPJ66_004756 [Kickxella alabastrina]
MASVTGENSNVAYTSRRSAVYGTRFMVASTQPLASNAGVRILEQGGNAADAAVAVAAALGVTEPFSTGLGGDCFCLFYSAKEKKVHGLNGSGRAPAALTIDRLRREFGVAGDEIPAHSAHAATVPGAAAGWVDTLQLFGSGRMSLADVLQPAIVLADSGFPVGELTSPFWRDGAKLLTTSSPNGGELLINGAGPLPGQVFQNPALASIMRLLAQNGARGFYEGPVASAIIDCLKESGCVMSLDDLCAHHSSTEEPISYEYRGHRLHECAPNCSGLAALLALGIVDALENSRTVPPVRDMAHNNAEHLHMVIEALRLAFADARRYVCDPDFSSVPVLQLLSPAYLAARAACFDPGSAAASITHGTPLGGSDTVYFSVVDAEGNACSFVNSTFHSFGTGIVPRGCGFALQDRGCLFSLDPAHPNCLEPRKRPYHTIIPAMVTTDGNLFMSYGIMGGFNQPQAHLQVLLNIVCFGMNPQQALDAPRICIQVEDGRVAIEDGVSQHTMDQLQRMGHSVYTVTGLQRSLFGRGQVIRQYTDQLSGVRVLVAGSDPRSDGQATGC